MATNKTVQGGVLELLALCKKNLIRSDEAFIKKAFEFAAVAHSDESRQSSEPYMTHPLAVAKILADEIPFDDVSIVCALLHDVVENNKDYSIEMIKKTFGPEVAVIVDGLTKVQNLFKGTDIDQSENYRKLLMSITKDVRVMIVKFADRLHNMRTLEFLPPDKRKRIAQETLEIYAPLAHRFGLGKVKWELEDLAFKELNRQAYDNLKRKINAKRNEREDFVSEFIKPLEEKLKETSYEFEISGRAKHLYSIYRKMIKRNKPFEEIFDLFAVRIIVDSADPYSCYAALGIVNGSYNPIQERFKDYIAIPKANNYQSLHTTVYGPSGRPIEVQIRTRKMHEISEQGVAAHWRYKEGSTGKDAAIDQYVNWIRELLDNSGGDELRKNIIENFRLNLYTQEIYIFTPKGELKRLPVNATPVDFAFSIHTAVGFHCIGAKVNGRIVPLDTVLHSGDQVEVITSKNQNPNRNWLKFVQTHKAKQDIKKWLNKEEDDVINKGKDIWEKKLRKLRLTYSHEDLLKFVHDNKFDNTRQFFKEIGQGKVDIDELLRLSGDKEKKSKEIQMEFQDFAKYARATGGSMLVDGDKSNVMFSYAKCCNPIPGDPAIGFITTGEGVKIHRKSCKNLLDISKKEPDKIVSIQWPEAEGTSFIVGLHVFGEDSPGILNDVAQSIVTFQNTNIKAINIDTNDSFFEGTVTLFVRDIEHLSRIIERLKKIKGMSKVSRLES
ncbi:MAG: bifunctional (p)ppGpp synthetase/guanosine-3',5'-bis(diphosphate) 3'-pyrophosphohydrolase [Ignavibacteriales bacterium]|nr:bifunctional (p)ppGpp synthetase/guanosine-3',5'-bis(diphosphate) 3'-pyrophosphohydrolase [Ignavibacteriales bacterium]